jgi:maleylpyruvate isomerase
MARPAGPELANEVKTIQGRTVPASETVRMRTREAWIHAGGSGRG